MDLYGYDSGFCNEDDPVLRQLGEVSVMANDAAELRRIASFLSEAAERVEARHDPTSDDPYTGLNPDWHFHYRDWDPEWTEGSGDLIVIRPQK